MSKGPYWVNFTVAHPDGRKEEIATIDVGRCPFLIIVADHYRPDGSCKCDDLKEREKMIAEWEYSDSDFKDIPLRR